MPSKDNVLRPQFGPVNVCTCGWKLPHRIWPENYSRERNDPPEAAFTIICPVCKTFWKLGFKYTPNTEVSP